MKAETRLRDTTKQTNINTAARLKQQPTNMDERNYEIITQTAL